ncbi:MAG: response regulator transcription factor [Candidatus Omnitrophica bacterium]|nr:response regulator transcription factor [Candidatus Omnitrophota bacterium]
MKKILVVDDDPNICELLKLRLESNGYEVIKASNGVEAFVKASDEKPDLIILDVAMPTMDGLEFVRSTRRFDMKDIPILILTARTNSKEIFDTFGVANFLTKPFDSKELLGKVAECIKN